jgi:hypothetical protein
MKTSEVVFELKLALADKIYPGLISTRVFVNSESSLRWVFRAVKLKLWGLVGKNRYVLVKKDDGQIYPLFIKVDTLTGYTWKANDEVIRFFSSGTTKKPKVYGSSQQELTLNTSDESAVKIAATMVLSQLAADNSEGLDLLAEQVKLQRIEEELDFLSRVSLKPVH